MSNDTVLYILQDTAIHIFNNTENITSSRVCGILLQGNECSKDDPSLEWTINIDPGRKPEFNRIDNKEADVRVSPFV
jgi:hypothetical protein